MKVFGTLDARSARQLQTCIDASGDPTARAVLCADHHPGYSMPIGGVLALRDHVIPAGVGFDIACGNCAVRTDVRAADVAVARVMDEVWRTVSFGMGRQNREPVGDLPVFERIAHAQVAAQRGLLTLAQDQLGTVGSGNHYVDLFEDRADGRLWVGVHFGSRGFGHKTASGFLAVAAGKRFGDRVSEGGMDSAPLLLDTRLPSGADYVEAMTVAGEYAYAGRDWVVNRVLKILGARDTDRIHNHHNFAWRERHDGVDYWVIRKGATPAFPGQRGFVGGTMGEDAVILVGVESALSAEAFYSTVHGAGRVMSRTEAAGKAVWSKGTWQCGQRDCGHSVPMRTLERGPQGELPRCEKCGTRMHQRKAREQARTGGRVDWPAAQRALQASGVELRGGGADEAPEAYKRLPEVLAAHAGTVEILHRLRPVGVAMAGPDVADEFRD